MEVTLEQAYAKACQIIGEQTVQQRLLAEAQNTEKPNEPGEQ